MIVKKFEYKKYVPKYDYVLLPEELIEKINAFGEDGWELVSVTVTNYGGETFYFKREKQSNFKQ